jgi:LmbE family N-acetylglucosaminyl deacetylase
MNLVVIVAHPDDEAVWFGGILHRLRARYRLLIVSVTHAGDPVREGEFRRACGILQAIPYLLEFKDGGEELLPSVIPELETLLARHAIESDGLTVVTHSPAGEEHWHAQHIQLHWQIAAWAEKRGVDFGFFSGHPGISALSPFLSREEALVSWWLAHPKKRLLRESLLMARAIWRYRLHESLKVPIDQDFKQRLLTVYEAQSLKGYSAYNSPFEFFFTRNPGIIALLKGA